MGLIKRIGYAVGRAVGTVLKLANLVTGIPAGQSTQDRDQRRR
ncbi:hypothetical protein [Amycolatopsis viridis]|uniref:Uncharacterized protein n=1 Tax=Amycolatopsis viridis TaxID=185678 RepID=A0ABX0T2M2_9PSEU|nr:hypothetical protein [Amycolatopsis viridis]NIH82884.1 hypothetical protein [Amycolatopsis viridis]